MSVSARKRLLVPEAEEALQQLRQEILKDIRVNRHPMREHFRDTARRVVEQDDATNRNP